MYNPLQPKKKVKTTNISKKEPILSEGNVNVSSISKPNSPAQPNVSAIVSKDIDHDKIIDKHYPAKQSEEHKSQNKKIKEHLTSKSTFSHKNQLINDQGDLSHVIDNIILKHRENTAGEERYKSKRQNLFAYASHIKNKYPQLKGFANLNEEDVRENEARVPLYLMRKLKESYEEEKDESKRNELSHQINSIYTGLHHWVQKQEKACKSPFETGKTVLGNAHCSFKNRQKPEIVFRSGGSNEENENDEAEEQANPKNKNKKIDEDESATQYAKSFLPKLSEASSPKLIGAIKEFKAHVGEKQNEIVALKSQYSDRKKQMEAEITALTQQMKSSGDPNLKILIGQKKQELEAFKTQSLQNIDSKVQDFKRVKTDYDNIEYRTLSLDTHHLLSYSKNFKQNIEFLQWYRKDIGLSDINIAHLFNSHPLTKNLKGLFGNVDNRSGKFNLEANEQQVKNLLLFKILWGPTSVNTRPDPNAQIAMRILEDGYMNIVRSNGGKPIPPKDLDIVNIMRSANLDQRNYSGPAKFYDIKKDGFFDSQGNPLKVGKYPDGVEVYTKDKKTGELKTRYTKWLKLPGAVEKFLKFAKENPNMDADSFANYYFFEDHSISSNNTPPDIRKEPFLRAMYSKVAGDPEGKLLFEEASHVPGLVGMGHKLGAYISKLALANLDQLRKLNPDKYGKTLDVGGTVDRVQMELLANLFNVVHGGVPENPAQRAMYTHVLLQTAAELGWHDVDEPVQGDNRTASSDMTQAATWEDTQGLVKTLGGRNASDKFSQGIVKHLLNAKETASNLATTQRNQGNNSLADELDEFSKGFSPILPEQMYESKHDAAKRELREQQFRGLGGSNTSLDDKALQNFLDLIPKKPQIPPTRLSKSSNKEKKLSHLIKLLKSGKPIRYAQFTPVNGGMQSAPVSDRTNVPFGNAVAKVNTGKNIAHAQLNDQVAQKAGVRTTSSTAIGDWPNGSEQSTMHTADSMTEPERMRYLAAWHGLASQKKSVLVFHPNPKGPDSLYHINHPETDLGKLREQLNQFNLQYKTLIPGAKGTKVILFDPAKSNRSAIDQFATKNNLEVVENTGQGEILGHNGDWNSAGALPKSRQAYNNIIAQYEQNQNSTRSSSNPSGASPSGKQGSAGETKKQLQRAGRAIKFDKARRILEGFLRAHNTPNKELPHVGDLLANDLQNIKPEHITKYQQLVPGAKWNEIENAVTSLKSDPTLYEDMTSEANRREMYCKEHARTVLHSSGLQKLLDSLVVQKAIPEHAQHLIPDAKDGDYFALEAISAELNHGIPALKAFAKAAEREYNKAGKAWDKMRGGVQKFSKPHHSKSQHRASGHGIINRGLTYKPGQFAPQGDGVARFEKGCSKMNAIYKTINKFRGS